ncbi:MAG: pyruvate dehydrogenase (acetyl-transferring) E1 component subunit alpha [Halobacteriota archaeon]
MSETADLHRVLDDDGTLVEGAKVPELSDEQLVQMYRDMRLARQFDERAISLQRQGRMGTYASLAGQEGAQVGSTHALADTDWILFQYREHGAVVVRGLDADYLTYWMGHEAGNAALVDKHIFPLNISVGAHLPHAVGMAWASKLKGERRAFVCHFGDGATSEGDFHEAMNFAGVFDTPTIFFCNNNQWAISIPRERQTASVTIAQKAIAYGFESVRVDGMDPLAVYKVTREAAEKAKDPEEGQRRPTLVEAVQYRFGAHTTADDPTVYRDADEVERWRAKDPISRFESFLRETGRLDDEGVDAIESEVREHVSEIVREAETFEADPEIMFDYAYEELPPELRRQRESFERFRVEFGDESFLRDE